MRLAGRFIHRETILAAVASYELVEAYPDDKYLLSRPTVSLDTSLEGMMVLHGGGHGETQGGQEGTRARDGDRR